MKIESLHRSKSRVSQPTLVHLNLGIPRTTTIVQGRAEPTAWPHAKAQLGEELTGVRLEGPPGDNTPKRARLKVENPSRIDNQLRAGRRIPPEEGRFDPRQKPSYLPWGNRPTYSQP